MSARQATKPRGRARGGAVTQIQHRKAEPLKISVFLDLFLKPEPRTVDNPFSVAHITTFYSIDLPTVTDSRQDPRRAVPGPGSAAHTGPAPGSPRRQLRRFCCAGGEKEPPRREQKQLGSGGIRTHAIEMTGA